MKKLKIPCLLAVLAMSVPTVVSAERAVHLSLQNGTVHSYSLSASPKITFEGEELTITDRESSHTVNRSDVDRIYIAEDIASSVQIVDTSVRNLSFSGNSLVCDGEEILLYNLQGVPVAQGYSILSLSELNRGIYIAKAGNQSMKISIF